MPAQSVSHQGSTGTWTAAADLGESAPTPKGGLPDRLREIAFDRAAPSDALVLETARVTLEWLLERPDRWSWSVAARELEEGFAEWNAEQGWRGPAAVWFDTLRAAWHQGRVSHPDEAREYLAEEFGLWLCASAADVAPASVSGAPESDASASDSAASERPWNGAPLASGRRLASRTALGAHAAATLETHELVLLNAYSNTVAVALEAAWRAGKHPQVLVCEGLPTLEGRRMARRLSRAGLAVSVCYDAALTAALDRADRVWLGTEAIGADAFLGRVGTRSLLEEAVRREVPVQLLATSDKLMPASELARPNWPERDTWLLWDDAPENVRLETQCFEIAPLDLVEHIITECGCESPARLSLRALRAERPAACGEGERDVSIAPYHRRMTNPTTMPATNLEMNPTTTESATIAPATRDDRAGAHPRRVDSERKV
jgi:translation initiation factor 2B subunit (eIF-2B alpha/beta/delta family)